MLPTITSDFVRMSREEYITRSMEITFRQINFFTKMINTIYQRANHKLTRVLGDG